MIKRVGKDLIDGDIVELNQNSEPLFLYHNGRLNEITNQEYNHITKVPHKDRDWNLYNFRKDNK
jgi:hypothetical protein